MLNLQTFLKQLEKMKGKCWIYRRIRRTSPLLPITKCDDEMWALPPSYSNYNKHFHPFLKKEICERDERIPLFLAGQKKTRKDVLKLITHMKFISNFREIEIMAYYFSMNHFIPRWSHTAWLESEIKNTACLYWVTVYIFLVTPWTLIE